MKPRRDLIYLKESQFDVAGDEPDPRGWQVFGADRRQIGEVDDLIVGTADQKVEFLDVEVDAEELGLPENRRHALVPVERARLDEQDGNVFLDGISFGEIAAMPSRLSDITGGAERPYPTAERQEPLEEREARLTRSEEELVVGKQTVEAGDVEVGKRVETEHVKRPVTRMHEEVDVERHPAAAAEERGSRISDEEVHIPITEEEVVVEKRPRAKEEMVVRKREVEEQEDVEADVRKERFYVEQHDREEELRRRERER